MTICLFFYYLHIQKFADFHILCVGCKLVAADHIHSRIGLDLVWYVKIVFLINSATTFCLFYDWIYMDLYLRVRNFAGFHVLYVCCAPVAVDSHIHS